MQAQMRETGNTRSSIKGDPVRDDFHCDSIHGSAFYCNME